MTEPFSTVIADCAWSFSDSLPGPKRGADSHYHTINVEGLRNLRLPPIAPNAILFFWRVSAMPQEALDVVSAWGFTAKSELVWVKTTDAVGPEIGGYVRGPKGQAMLPASTAAFGMGHTARMNHETCIIATRGKTSPLVKSHSLRSVFFAPLGEHSAKPEEFFRIVEAMTEGPILELFARRERGGRYVCLGDEIGKQIGVGDGDLFRKVV